MNFHIVIIKLSFYIKFIVVISLAVKYSLIFETLQRPSFFFLLAFIFFQFMYCLLLSLQLKSIISAWKIFINIKNKIKTKRKNDEIFVSKSKFLFVINYFILLK